MRVEILHRIFGAEMNHQKICYIFVGTQLELEPLRIKGCNKANYIYIYVCIAYALYNYDKLTSSNACLSSFSEGFFYRDSISAIKHSQTILLEPAYYCYEMRVHFVFD